MKNDLIKSIYDLEEKPESIGRRDFLKKAGIAGLALAGLGSLGGCALTPNLDVNLKVAGRDFNKYDFDAIAREYETGKRQVIPINSIDDFALSGEELGWMRLAEGDEKIILWRESNPKKGRNDKYRFASKKGSPSIEEWLVAEYAGRIHYPKNNPTLSVNKFFSEEDRIRAQKIGMESEKDIPFSINVIRLSKGKFLTGITVGKFLSKEHEIEHRARMNLYQKKRGLDLAWSNF